MRVFNLTRAPLQFRKKVLAADGGSEEFPELDKFIPNHDRALATKNIVALGSLPNWWVLQRRAEMSQTMPAQEEKVAPVVMVAHEPAPQVEIKNKKK